MTEPPVDILLVEGNSGHARLAQEALQTSRPPCRVFLVTDGVGAMAFLRREGAHPRAPRPQLILLDLDLPRNEGWEVLARIKKDDTLKQIPMIVLCSSRAEKDIARAYELKANCYVIKSPDLKAFQAVLRGIEEFWIATVSLPFR